MDKMHAHQQANQIQLSCKLIQDVSDIVHMDYIRFRLASFDRRHRTTISSVVLGESRPSKTSLLPVDLMPCGAIEASQVRTIMDGRR